MLDRNDVGQTFDQWKAECNALVEKELGQSIADLPDWQWWGSWHEDLTPEEAFIEFCIDNSDAINIPV